MNARRWTALAAWACCVSALPAGEPRPAWAVPALEGVTIPGLPPVTGHLHVDQFGYLPAERKVAVLSDPQRGFNAGDRYSPPAQLEIRRAADGAMVFSGPPLLYDGGRTDAVSGDRGWWFDFTPLHRPGRYYVFDPALGRRSPVFRIGADVYAPVLRAAMRVFYYQREATAHRAPWAEPPWQDGPSFLQDQATRAVWARDDPSTARDLHGGWADAGDTNKYPSFLSEVIHPLLYAWQANPAVFTDDFDIPESGNGLPDLLDEVKWELEWLARMQDADGGVFIKMGMASVPEGGAHGPQAPDSGRATSPYSRDRHPRFYAPKCSASTIVAAGVFAHAARVYAAFGPWKSFAADLRARAERAWQWYLTHPRSYDCDTHAVMSGPANLDAREQDAAEAVAAMHLWALTGEARYHDDFRAKFASLPQLAEAVWAPHGMGQANTLFEYLSLPGADRATCARIAQAYRRSLQSPQFMPQHGEDELYRAWMPVSSYHWGSNRTRACHGLAALEGADAGLAGPLAGRLRQRALDQLHALHGVNPLSLVYLSNMGRLGAELSAVRMYHEWFGDDPAPGYLVGGPNRDYDGNLAWVREQPPAKAYAELNNAPGNRSYELTEPAIYYQATYIRLLSAFTESPKGEPSGVPPPSGGPPPESSSR